MTGQALSWSFRCFSPRPALTTEAGAMAQHHPRRRTSNWIPPHPDTRMFVGNTECVHEHLVEFPVSGKGVAGRVAARKLTESPIAIRSAAMQHPSDDSYASTGRTGRPRWGCRAGDDRGSAALFDVEATWRP